jgi:glycosyltransferase involved in cell wall biosynthesis
MGGMFKGAKVPGGKFLTALAEARARGAPIELHLYGRQSAEFEQYRETAAAYGLTYHGVVPRDQVPRELRRYDYQLLLLDDLPNSKLIMHLKLPEYLAAGVPILAVVPEGSAVEDILRSTGTGIVVPADGDWAEGLVKLASSRESRVTPNQQEIARYSWDSVKHDWRRALAL